MSLPATRLALPHVGTAGNQRPHPAARPDPQVCGVFRRRQCRQRSVCSHDVRHLQRRDLSGLSQAVAAPTNTGPVHDPRARQCSLSSRNSPAPIPASQRPTPAAAVSATLQPATRSDRARLETGPALGNAQPLLRNASRRTEGRQRLLRSLAPTEQRVAPLMLHYLRRCV
jgi:hypothetical protein